MVRRWLMAGGTILALGAASASVAQQTAVAKPNEAVKPAARARQNTKPAPKAKAVESPEAVAETAAAPPPTPEQSPAAAPQVSFQNGELSIRSDNATLSSILNAVKTQTGASVDAPGSTSSDRIATQLGPGDPRDVLTTLLNNSKYDFILLGAPGSPTSVQKIILTARAAGAGSNVGGAAAPSPNRAAPRNFQVPAEVEQENNDQELPDAEVPDDTTPAEQPPQPDQPEQPEQPEQQQPNGQPADQNQQPGNANPNQPKTPEQLLQELQRMQQQQQQQQEQQRQQNLNPQ